MRLTRSFYIDALIISILLIAGLGCEKSGSDSLTSDQALLAPVIATPLDLPKPLDLTAPGQKVPSRVMEVSSAEIWPPCYTIFEEEGAPRDEMKVEDEAQHAEMLWGCEMEAHARGANDERYYAYGLKSEDRLRASDQRIVAYDSQGKLLWHHTLDRDSDAMNFASSRRSSFIVELPPYLACGGTRWDGSLEYVCAKLQEKGAVAWQGKLSQWSGTDPVANSKSLTFGDITTIKKIYPWEGVERVSAPLDGTGGYSAVYATDGAMHVFSANRVPWKVLTGVNLTSMHPVWKRTFEETFDPLWSHSYAEHDLTLLLQEDTIIGIETSSGKTLWRLTVESDAPPMASSSEALYLLMRRAQGPNLIYAIEPRTGKALWYAAPPTGTLDIAYDGGTLLLKSIRSVQRAWLDKKAPSPELAP